MPTDISSSTAPKSPHRSELCCWTMYHYIVWSRFSLSLWRSSTCTAVLRYFNGFMGAQEQQCTEKRIFNKSGFY